MSKVLIGQSVSNVSLYVLKLAVAFFLTPVFVHALGDYDYGINEIVLSFIGYMGLLEIGLQPAVTYFVARYNASGDKESLLRVFNNAFFFSVIIGCLMGLIILVWALTGANGLVQEHVDKTRYIYFLLIIACQVLVSFPGHVILCVHQGHQRYGLTNLVAANNTIIGSIIVYIFLKHGYGLLFLTVANTIGMASKFLFLLLLLKKKSFGGYRFQLGYINVTSLRELFVFGGKSFLLGVASSFSKRASPILIGGLISPAAVVFYTIPNNLIGYLANLVSAATLSFMPYFSNLFALGDIAKVRSVFLSSSRCVAGISGCGFLSVVFLGPEFLRLWVGPEYALKGTSILFIAALTAFLRNLNPFHGRILTGMNLQGALAKIRAFEAVAYLILSIPLIQFDGIEGVALSILAASLIAEPIVLRLVCHQIDEEILEYFKKVVFGSIIPLLPVGCFYYTVLINFQLTGYSPIVLVGVIGCLLYSFVFMLTSVSSEERRDILAMLGKMVKLACRPFLSRP